MMGEALSRQDRLFYEFDLEDMVPGDLSSSGRSSSPISNNTPNGLVNLTWARPAEIQSQSRLRFFCHGLPFRHRQVAGNSKRASGDEMALDVK